MAETIDYGSGWQVSETSSVNTPNFHALVKAGEWLPVNDYFRYVRKGRTPTYEMPNGPEKYGAVQADFIRAILVGGHQGPGGFHPMPDLDYWHTHVSDVLARKVRDPTFNAGVSFGESRETAELFSDAARRVTKATRQARRGNFRKAYDTLTRGYVRREFRKTNRQATARRNVKKDNTGFVRDANDVANNYLAYIYGVRPIVNDVHDAISLLDNVYSGEPPPTKSGFLERRRLGDLNASPFKYNNIEGKLTLRGGVYYVVKDHEWFLLQDVGLANPPSVLYELVPYSFVVDWFVNVGDWILSQQTPAGLSFKGGWTSVTAEGTATLGVYGYPLRADCDGWLYSRRSLQDWPHIELRVNTDPFGGWLNTDHRRRIIDSIALVTTALT